MTFNIRRRMHLKKIAEKVRAGILIPKAAIKAFMDRPRKDYSKWKELTEDDCERMMLELPTKPPIWYKLKLHQKICFLIGAKIHRFYYINDTGTGKTVLSIALVRYFRKIGTVRRTLVLVPNRINKTEWEDQLREHSPKSSYTILRGSSEEKWKQLEAADTLFIFETYMGLVRLVCDLKMVKRRGKKPKPKLVPNKTRVRKLLSMVQGLIGDESTVAKNSSKLPYRICRRIAKEAKIVFMLTGTPFNRDPTEMWAQMFLVDGGETLGKTMGLFRAAFFKAKVEYWGNVKYSFDHSKEELLNRFLANRSISYEADPSTLPKVEPIRKYVSLPEDAEVYYERAKREIIAARGNYEEMRNIFLRMRQISSGFIGYRDDETGDKAKFVFPEQPKLESLLSTIETIRPDHKAIIFCEFNYSIERIYDELRGMGHHPTMVYGKQKDVQAARDAFKKKDKHQFLILQNKMGMGLNVQVAKYGLYYESPVSAIDRKQTKRRVERQYSRHDLVVIMDFIMRGTMDERVLDFHKEGGDLFQALIRGEIAP